MNYFNEGDVVICPTKQAGTIVQLDSDCTWVLLANLNLWVGQSRELRKPKDQEEVNSCPLEVDRFEERERTPRPRSE